MQSELDKMEPCPFCGGKAERHTIGDDEPNNAGGDVICCTVCQASSHVEFGRKENLVSHWNRRATIQAIGEQQSVGWQPIESARAAFIEGYEKANESSMPAHLAWELSDSFERLRPKQHLSDCAVHNAPAMEPGPCDCAGYSAKSEVEQLREECERLRFGLRYWRDQYIGETVAKAIAKAALPPPPEGLKQ